jgi:Pyruvate/2-oxoacid:ferredoxin oxidoreductase delta subunit
MQDRSCKATDRREVCMSMGDLADLYVEEGWARKIDQEEAFEIVRRNEEEGLVLMPANEQEPNFMCACCSDCCGMLTLMKNFPKPAEVVASNFYAEVDTGLCKGCGTCRERCPIDAVAISNNVSSIDLKRCIGCGLCVPSCPEKAMHLVAKEKEVLPPQTMEDHLNTIYTRRMSVSGKMRSFVIKSMIRIAMRF